MAYHYLDFEQLHAFCSAAFCSYGFDENTSRQITDILLAADLNGIESHGVQRMVRYDYEITCGMVAGRPRWEPRPRRDRRFGPEGCLPYHP